MPGCPPKRSRRGSSGSTTPVDGVRTTGPSGRRFETRVVRTRARRFRGSWQRAPQRTARTGRCSGGGDIKPTSAYLLGSPATGHGSFACRTGADRSRNSRSGSTGVTAAAGTISSGDSRISAALFTASRRRRPAIRSIATAASSTSTRSTRRTGAAGGVRMASYRGIPTGRSVTASSRTSPTRASRGRRGRDVDTALRSADRASLPTSCGMGQDSTTSIRRTRPTVRTRRR